MLKLEVGKFYETRDGKKRGPLVYFPEFGDKPYGTMRDEWWYEDGLRTASDGTDGKDLIAEWREVAMETGTLKELNVKPGDVVECVEARTDLYTVGKRYLADDEGNIWNNWDWVDPTPQSTFRIISRAAQTPDLTAITTPFGLLDEATQEALRAHGGPYEYWFCEEWKICDYSIDGWDGDYVYRVKKAPVIESAQVDIYCRGHKASAFIQLKDGKPDWSTLQVRND